MELTNNTYDNPELLLSKEAGAKGQVSWSSPSNIALVKYWGKRDNQLPMNPSISYTLNNSLSKTSVAYSQQSSGKLQFQFYFEGKAQQSFEPKLQVFFNKLEKIFPFLDQLSLEIHSENTFPHSAGIASSASAMSAMALCLCSVEQKLFATLSDEKEFYAKASFVARLGSGSAARSVYGGLVNWGKTEHLSGASDYAGTALSKIHPVFKNYQDSIIILSAAKKKVSSTAGHGMMNNHPFAEQRFNQARAHHTELLKVLEAGNVQRFIEIVEAEALSLHAMMMTSNPGFILMDPATIAGIEKIRTFRNETGIKVCFTLDAGPNIHLLYAEEDKSAVLEFIEMHLNELNAKSNVIFDREGNGSVSLIERSK